MRNTVHECIDRLLAFVERRQARDPRPQYRNWSAPKLLDRGAGWAREVHPAKFTILLERFTSRLVLARKNNTPRIPWLESRLAMVKRGNARLQSRESMVNCQKYPERT